MKHVEFYFFFLSERIAAEGIQRTKDVLLSDKLAKILLQYVIELTIDFIISESSKVHNNAHKVEMLMFDHRLETKRGVSKLIFNFCHIFSDNNYSNNELSIK